MAGDRHQHKRHPNTDPISSPPTGDICPPVCPQRAEQKLLRRSDQAGVAITSCGHWGTSQSLKFYENWYLAREKKKKNTIECILDHAVLLSLCPHADRLGTGAGSRAQRLLPRPPHRSCPQELALFKQQHEEERAPRDCPAGWSSAQRHQAGKSPQLPGLLRRAGTQLGRAGRARCGGIKQTQQVSAR